MSNPTPAATETPPAPPEESPAPKDPTPGASSSAPTSTDKDNGAGVPPKPDATPAPAAKKRNPIVRALAAAWKADL